MMDWSLLDNQPEDERKSFLLALSDWVCDEVGEYAASVVRWYALPGVRALSNSDKTSFWFFFQSDGMYESTNIIPIHNRYCRISKLSEFFNQSEIEIYRKCRIAEADKEWKALKRLAEWAQKSKRDFMELHYESTNYPKHIWEDESYHGSPDYVCICCGVKAWRSYNDYCPKAQAYLEKKEVEKIEQEKNEYQRLLWERQRFEELHKKYGPKSERSEP